MRGFLAILTALVLALAGPVIACGPDTDCMVGERSYRIVLPPAHKAQGPVPVIAHAHGYRGSAAGVMRNGALRRLAADLGAALIAFNARNGSWALPNHPGNMASDGAEEFAYVEAVLEDATARFDLDETRMMATGFSGGGMLIWNLACVMPQRFAGFAPVAGTFWLEPPSDCATPVQSLVHIHGDADTVVPLLGRVIGPTKQGEVPEALAMYGALGGFSDAEEVSYEGLACEQRSNAAGEILDFCLFKGGHFIRTEFVRHAWDRLKDAGQF